MATADFAPLFRSAIGFERPPLLITEALQRQAAEHPPYNIEKLGEDSYRIVMAVPGFSEGDIEVVTEPGRLTVSGEIKSEGEKAYLHRGIAIRPFSRSFGLADFVEVTGATLTHGLLVIELRRELPEAMRPRKLKIQSRSQASEQPKQLERIAA